MYIYSPQNANPEDLDRTLTCDRRELAERMISRLLEAFKIGGAHHQLVIAPRGAGKTHLLTYIRNELETKQKALAVIPMSEEERGITSLLDILLAVLSALETSPPDYREQIREAGPESAIKRAEEIVDAAIREQPTLLIVENLGDLFNGMEQQVLLAFRAFLERHPQLSIMASSVTLFERSKVADHPFHGFFTIHPLVSLDLEGAIAYLCQLAELKDDYELVKALKRPEGRERVEAIHALTGGNHRFLAQFAEFLSTKGLDELVDPFIRLVDRELTPYFQQRLDRLSPQQNKILNAIADHHGTAITVKEIADYTFTTSQTVSSQLRDLLRDSYVQRNPVGREACYELREPLLRLVLDIKEGRDGPLPLIVSFLRHWYRSYELLTLMQQCNKISRSYYEAALKEGDIEKRFGMVQGTTKDYVKTSVDKLCERRKGAADQAECILLDDLLAGLALEDKSRYEEALILYRNLEDTVTNDVSQPYPDDLIATLFFRQGFVLGELDRKKEALRAYEKVIDRYSDSEQPELQELLAKSFFNRGVALSQLDKSTDALAAYQELVNRWSTSGELPIQKLVASTINNQAGVLSQSGRAEEALVAIDNLLDRYGDSSEPELQEPIAVNMFNRGVILGDMSRIKESLVAYTVFIDRWEGSEDPKLKFHVAQAFFNQAMMLTRTDRREEALVNFDTILNRYGDSENADYQEVVAKATLYRGVVLAELGRSEESIAALETLIGRFGDFEDMKFRIPVAKALFSKSVALSDLGRTEDELEVYDALVNRYGNCKESELRVLVVQSFLNRGVALVDLGRKKEGLAALEDLLDRYGNSEEPEFQDAIVSAWSFKAKTLRAEGQPKEARVEIDKWLSRNDYFEQPELQIWLIKALIERAAASVELGEFNEALSDLNSLLRRYGNSNQPEDQALLANALFLQGLVLGQAVGKEEMLTAFDTLYGRFADSEQPDVQIWVAKALMNWSGTMSALGKHQEALLKCDALLNRYGDSRQEEVRRAVAGGLFNKIIILNQLGRLDEMLAVVDIILSRYGHLEEPWVQELVGRILDRFILTPDIFSKVAKKLSLNTGLLLAGLIYWTRRQLPLQPNKVAKFAEQGLILLEAFGDIEEVKMALDVIVAVRHDAEGDPKGLLALPKEIRQLVQSEQ